MTPNDPRIDRVSPTVAADGPTSSVGKTPRGTREYQRADDASRRAGSDELAQLGREMGLG